MKTFKAAILVICLFAVAVNPVAAAFLPCCCTRQAETKRPCCESKAENESVNSAERHACCAKPSPRIDATLRAGCCCVKAIPESILARYSLGIPPGDNPSFESALWIPSRVHSDSISALLRDNSPSHFALSGAPLLALHCIWLK